MVFYHVIIAPPLGTMTCWSLPEFYGHPSNICRDSLIGKKNVIVAIEKEKHSDDLIH